MSDWIGELGLTGALCLAVVLCVAIAFARCGCRPARAPPAASADPLAGTVSVLVRRPRP